MDENDELATKVDEQVFVAGERVAGNAETGGVIEGLPAEPCTHCLNVTAPCAGSTASWRCPQGERFLSRKFV